MEPEPDPDPYRWVVLAAGTGAQAGYSAVSAGITVLAPAVRSDFGLSLGQVGLALASLSIGGMVSLIPWGIVADRVGEQTVIGIGLIGASIALALAAYANTFLWFFLALTFVGLLGASVNAASGRAVMNWFDQAQRGIALGIRQAAVPLGGLAAALVVPHLHVRAALLTLAGVMLAGGTVGCIAIRDRRSTPTPPANLTRGPLRDRRVWLLSSGSALLVTAQVCVVGFAVVFLHEERGVSIVAAGGFLAVIQIGGALMRIGAGLWSDRLGSRLLPLTRISLALAVALATLTASTRAPMSVLLPIFVFTGCLAMGWNGLAFTAVAEHAGRSQSGVALGLQQTSLSAWAAAAAPGFAFLVDATSWQVGFGFVALTVLAANRLLATQRFGERPALTTAAGLDD